MTQNSEHYFPIICNRYLSMIKEYDPECKTICNTDYPADIWHISWMLEELKTNKTMSLTKKHRWLGYIQGVLFMRHIIDVDEECDFTRPLFNGA